MRLPAFANLFELVVSPYPDRLYRGLRPEGDEMKSQDLILAGRHVYSLTQNKLCPEIITSHPFILKNIIRRYLATALAECDQFFDVSEFDLSGAIAGNLLYKEEVFSIAQSFQLQIVFSQRALYMAVLANQRVYNRLRLPEVLDLLGSNWMTLPQKALCFAGKGPAARWRDGQILSFNGDSCLVRIPSIRPSEVTLPTNRIIPKLGTATIKRLLHLKGSRTPIEQKLKSLRSGTNGNEGKKAAESTNSILRNYIAPLFPLSIGAMRVHVGSEAATVANLSVTRITQPFRCVSKLDGRHHVFDSLVKGLQQVSSKVVIDHPVAIFATEETKGKIQNLIRDLHDPPDNVGGFRGLPTHFGIRLRPVDDSPFVVRDVEEYIDAIRDLTLSPSAEKRTALVFIVLSEEDETYRHPVPLYYRLKALLARAGHPSQMVDYDTLTNKFARWNLALNIAAKLGAIPWTLEDVSILRPVDLFLGFSYSTIRREALGQSRNIAYVNVFDSAGTWQVFCADGSVFSFEDRLRTFPRIASDAVRSATDDPSSLRFIEVHYNKRFGYKERQAIANGVRSQSPNASIVFVSITDSHPVRFFDPAHSQYSLARGAVLKLGDGASYVQTVDPSKVTGLPRPLRLQIYRDFCLANDDPSDVSKRVLALTRLNWRSVKDFSSLPVTVLYSSRVARLTNYFSLTDWRDIDHSLKRTPWFL